MARSERSRWGELAGRVAVTPVGRRGLSWVHRALARRYASDVKLPGASVLLSGAVAQRRIHPLRPSLDLTVAMPLGNGTEAAEATAALAELQRRDFLSRRLLYDLDLVARREVAAMMALGGLWEWELGEAQLLRGSDPRPSRVVRSPADLDRERLVYSFKRWCNAAPPLLAMPPTTTRAEDARRLFEDVATGWLQWPRGRPLDVPRLHRVLDRCPLPAGPLERATHPWLSAAFRLLELHAARVTERWVRVWPVLHPPPLRRTSGFGGVPGVLAVGEGRRHPLEPRQVVILLQDVSALDALAGVPAALERMAPAGRRPVPIGPESWRAAALLPQPPFLAFDLARERGAPAPRVPPAEVLSELMAARLAECFTVLRSSRLRPRPRFAPDAYLHEVISRWLGWQERGELEAPAEPIQVHDVEEACAALLARLEPVARRRLAASAER